MLLKLNVSNQPLETGDWFESKIVNHIRDVIAFLAVFLNSGPGETDFIVSGFFLYLQQPRQYAVVQPFGNGLGMRLYT